MMYKYYALYKPYGYLSQFSDSEKNKGLGQLLPHIEKDVYPLGRLDADSEGLLLLTNNKSINHQLLNPKFAHKRTYCVQVEHEVTDEALAVLSKGNIQLKHNKKPYKTKKAKASHLDEVYVSRFEEREPPVRFRKSVPTSWLSLELTEGKNRQVRKMTAHVGFPTLRLIRTQIGQYHLPSYTIGKLYEISEKDFMRKVMGR